MNTQDMVNILAVLLLVILLPVTVAAMVVATPSVLIILAWMYLCEYIMRRIGIVEQSTSTLLNNC